MKHLRKFYESNGDECSFKDFKNIMFEILDDFNFEYEFNDYSSDEDAFFDCQIYILRNFDYYDKLEMPNLNNIDYIDIYHFEEPDNIDDIDFEETSRAIDENISEIEKIVRESNEIIQYHKNIKSLLERLNKDLIPRFENYYNFESCVIGKDDENLRICFNIKNNEDNEDENV
jgi:hypothetical protein